MCGGIAYDLSKVPEEELRKYFSSDDIADLRKKGRFENFYWSKIPVLPVEKHHRVQLMKWGNREGEKGIPKTGWTKQESIESGKWMYLHPNLIKILANYGYEKGKWFPIESGGLKGLLVEKNDQERIFMVTKPASPKYHKSTGHDREPLEY